ncbi:MAG: hypothetical protein V1806_03755 [Pseudomonadota bacterium]
MDLLNIGQFMQGREATEELTAETEILPGFFVTLAYCGPEALKKINKKAERTKYIGHQPITTADDQVLLQGMAKYVKGWRGLTLRMMSNLLAFSIADLDEDEKDQEVPFTPHNLQALLDKNQTFGFLLKGSVGSSGIFQKVLEGELKNVPSGPVGGSSPAESPAASA